MSGKFRSLNESICEEAIGLVIANHVPKEHTELAFHIDLGLGIIAAHTAPA